MKNILLISFLIINSILFAQPANVLFDYETNSFNQNQPLPAEQFLVFYGEVSPQIQKVEVVVYRNLNKNAVEYKAHWNRSFGNNKTTFNVPFNYKLRGGSQYDIAIKQYRFATDFEKENLKNDLLDLLKAHINQSFTRQKRGFSVKKKSNEILNELNSIVTAGLENYENKENVNFNGFSDILFTKLKQLDDAKLKNAKFYYPNENKEDAKSNYQRDLVNELNQIMEKELQQIFNTNLLVVADVIFVYDYPTQKTKNILSFHVGYGGVFLGKPENDFEYGTSPFIGLSVPFGNKQISNKFWTNLSADFGVMLLNMEAGNGETVSGPIVKRPIYAGLGYKFLKFFKIQAGYSLIEYQDGGNNQFFNASKIGARPYVGVGAQFNFWMDFAK